jgi:hypothetical protein
LDKSKSVSLFVRWHDAAVLQSLCEYADYLRRVFTIAARLRNFWYYRLKATPAARHSDAIEQPVFCKCDFGVPRQLASVWEFDATSCAGNIEYSNPEPYRWAFHKAFPEYPNVNEAAFLLKLGIDGERKRHTRDLMGLAQNDGRVWFRGAFKEMPKTPDLCVVKIWVDESSKAADRRIRMPAVGTKMQILFDPNLPYSAPKSSVIAYKGTVCPDLFN